MKKNVFFFALLFALSGNLHAEFKEKPDPNTLWIEDGKNITGWRSEIPVKSMPDGGFSILQSPDMKYYATGRYVPVSAEYPWLVTEITDVFPNKGYRSLNFRTKVGIVTNLPTGIFAFRVKDYANASVNSEFFRLDLYGMEVRFKYLKVVKIPENYIQADQQENKVKYYVRLQAPAEDVSLYLFDGYGMAPLLIDGSNKIQLKPVDENIPLEWIGTSSIPKKTKGCVVIKGSVMGSEALKVPLWGIFESQQK